MFGQRPWQQDHAKLVTDRNRRAYRPLRPRNVARYGKPVDLFQHDENMAEQLCIRPDSNTAVRGSNPDFYRCLCHKAKLALEADKNDRPEAP